MSVNFFTWIRDGVRQSVLLGVSDAIEHLGTPAATEDMHPSVMGFMKDGGQAAEAARLPNTSNKSSNQRKRLGRSLKELDGNGAAAQ